MNICVLNKVALALASPQTQQRPLLSHMDTDRGKARLE